MVIRYFPLFAVEYIGHLSALQLPGVSCLTARSYIASNFHVFPQLDVVYVGRRCIYLAFVDGVTEQVCLRLVPTVSIIQDRH